MEVTKDIAAAGAEVLPTMSVIVPSHNRANTLRRVVDPLLSDPATTELIVVIDGSSDASADLLGRMASHEPRLTGVAIDHGGKQMACEEGLRRASGEVVLLIDDDVVALEGMVTRHAHHHIGRDDLVVVGYMPTLLPPRRGAGDSPTFLYALEYERHCARLDTHPEAVLRELWGGNVSLHSAACRQVGWSSAEFPGLYHEDQDFGLRCLKAGMVGVFDRQIAAHHLHRRSIDAFLGDARSQGAGLWLVHHLHQDLLGELDMATFATGIPRPARWALRRAQDRSMARALLGPLTRAAKLGGHLGVFSAEEGALRLARRFEQQSGALAVANERTSTQRMARHELVA